jgi:CBS domain-containing protein
MTAQPNGTVKPTGRDLLVAHVMSRKPLLLHASMRLEPAVALLIDHGYSGAPVIDDHGHLTGMLHAVDIAVMHLCPPRDHVTEPNAARHLLVGEVARAPVTIQPTRTIHAAALMMRSHHTDRLAVVEKPDRVIGVVSGHDLLRTIVQRGDLLRELVEDQIAALDLPYVSAAIDLSGVVLLTGAVDSYQDRARLVRAIGALGGVTEVHELLTIVPPQREGEPGCRTGHVDKAMGDEQPCLYRRSDDVLPTGTTRRTERKEPP